MVRPGKFYAWRSCVPANAAPAPTSTRIAMPIGIPIGGFAAPRAIDSKDRIDAAMHIATGRRGLTLLVGFVVAFARISPPAALDAPGILAGCGWSRAGDRGDRRCQHCHCDQFAHARISHQPSCLVSIRTLSHHKGGGAHAPLNARRERKDLPCRSKSTLSTISSST